MANETGTAAPAPAVKKDAKAEVAAKKAKEKEKIAAAKAKEKADAAKAKEKERLAKLKADAKAKKAAEKEAKKNMPPVWVKQVDEHGNEETVDKNKFPFEVTCDVPDCPHPIRYVTLSGLKTVTKCKYHATQARRKRRVASRKEKAKKYSAIVADALKQGLFPDAFKKKWKIT